MGKKSKKEKKPRDSILWETKDGVSVKKNKTGFQFKRILSVLLQIKLSLSLVNL